LKEFHARKQTDKGIMAKVNRKKKRKLAVNKKSPVKTEDIQLNDFSESGSSEVKCCFIGIFLDGVGCVCETVLCGRRYKKLESWFGDLIGF
jgi:hypothetical protein